jgi:hypothetical protein
MGHMLLIKVIICGMIYDAGQLLNAARILFKIQASMVQQQDNYRAVYLV